MKSPEMILRTFYVLNIKLFYDSTGHDGSVLIEDERLSGRDGTHGLLEFHFQDVTMDNRRSRSSFVPVADFCDDRKRGGNLGNAHIMDIAGLHTRGKEFFVLAERYGVFRRIELRDIDGMSCGYVQTFPLSNGIMCNPFMRSENITVGIDEMTLWRKLIL